MERSSLRIALYPPTPRIRTRQASEASLNVDDFAGKVDLAVAFAMVHELSDPGQFFREFRRTLAAGGKVLLAEPSGHVCQHQFDTDYLDVLQPYWLGKMSGLTGAVQEELAKLRDEGKVHAVGASIHDRPRAGRLAADSMLDLLMIRYNAAHTGAETEILPHILPRRPAIVAYTATAWRKLLRKPKGWSGPVPTAGDCYRFCLSNPLVDVVITGPRNELELRENLAAAEEGPLTPAETDFMRAFGRVVHR